MSFPASSVTTNRNTELQQWFLTRGNFVSQGTMGNVWRHCWLSQLCVLGAAQRPTMYMTATQQRIMWQTATALSLRNPELEQ